MWLRVFREVARTGSFTAAAVPLGFTQSAVSRQVSALEHEVGAVLFDRLPRGVRLTASGRALLAHADAVLDRLDLAQRDLQALTELAAGRLAVGAFSTAEVALVPRALAAFAAAYPRVAVELAEGTSPQQVRRVRSGAIDVAVVSSTGGAALDDTRVELHLLLQEPLLVALPADTRIPVTGHPAERVSRVRGRVRLADLAGEAWIAGAENPEATLLADAVDAGFRPYIRYVAQEWTAKLGLVAAGLGVTLVPALAASGVRADVVLARLDPEDMPPRAVHAATGRGAALSPPARIFLDLLRRGAADLAREWREA
jgi:DNA-binding transcriptional LysR family regulator